MARIVVSVLLGVFLFWLILSYVPASSFTFHHFVWKQQVAGLFGVLLAVGLIGFVAIQGWLVTNTECTHVSQRRRTAAEEIRGEFGHAAGSEVLWCS